MENIDVEALQLKYQSLLEQVSQQAATYEDRVANLRVELHRKTLRVKEVEDMLQEYASPTEDTTDDDLVQEGE